MSAPSDHDSGEAPFLPSPSPTPPAAPRPPPTGGAPEAPFLPHATPPQPQPEAAPAAFDARAMVESQKRVNENPAYGALPQGTEESRAAARKLREQANRKRKRNKMIGWVVALVFLAGIGAAGFLAYREYQNDQDEFEADRAAAQADDGGDDPAALTPLGEQVEINEALEDLNDTVRPSAGGFLDAIDDAQAAVDDLNDVESVDPAEAADPPVVTAAPAVPDAVTVVPIGEARTISYHHRTWSAADPTSPSVEYFFSYDLVGDTYRGDVRPDDGSGGTIVGTSGDHRYSIAADGTVERFRRSGRSLVPAPDFTLARPLTVDALVPASADPFLGPAELTVGANGTSSRQTIDVEAWRTADPDGYRAWTTMWNPPAPLADAWVDPATRQTVALDADTSPMASWAPDDALTGAPAELAGPNASVYYEVGDDGYVTIAGVSDPVGNFLATYVFVLATDDVATFDFDDQDWVDAP